VGRSHHRRMGGEDMAPDHPCLCRWAAVAPWAVRFRRDSRSTLVLEAERARLAGG
jgi:hypothetical protein